jgi:hypothetical protein
MEGNRFKLETASKSFLLNIKFDLKAIEDYSEGCYSSIFYIYLRSLGYNTVELGKYFIFIKKITLQVI